MAVVIIVLGVTITMTLKGAVLIDIMKALITSYEIQFYQSRVQLYGVEFKYLPGDDPKADGRFGHPKAMTTERTGTIDATGDSKIDGKFLDLANPDAEHIMAWRDMRYARLLDGDPRVESAAALPTNLFGGVYGFDEGNLGQQKGSICLNKVSGFAAKRIDESIDGDGVINQGTIVATSKSDTGPEKGHFAAPDSQPYDVEKEYIICASLVP